MLPKQKQNKNKKNSTISDSKKYKTIIFSEVVMVKLLTQKRLTRGRFKDAVMQIM